MKKRLSLIGRITFSAYGAYIENFLTELMKSDIKVSNVYVKNDIIYIDVKRTDYLKISKIARKHTIRTRVVDRKGIYYNLKKLKKHRGIILGAVVSSFIFLILQRFIWHIKIDGVDKITENLIIESIYENGIHIGCLSSKIDTEFIELLLKNKLKDIEWINIRVNGSSLDIDIYEGIYIDKPEILLNTPCNVIAKRDGIIIDTEVYSGTLMYPKGSGIAKGNVIVSGIVNDGADNLLLTHANAKIIAEFNENVVFRKNYKTIEKEKVNEQTEKEIMILGFTFPITKKINKDSNMVCNEQIKKYEIFGITMPWKIKTNTYYTYNDVSVTRTSKDILNLLEQELELYCKNFFNDYEIIDISKSVQTDSEGITLSANIKLHGNIAVKQEIYDKNN